MSLLKWSSLSVLFLAVSAFAAGGPKVIQVTTQGSDLAFNKTALTVKANQKVKLTFENKSSKDSGMQHNWVLVKPGTADAIGQASMTVGPDKGYLTDSPDIVAHTKLLNSGEKDTIEFTAPATPGDYPYICSFPGHYTVMKGILKVIK